MNSQDKDANTSAAPQKAHVAKPGRIILLLMIAALAVFVVWGIWRAANPPLPPLQGQMEARVINVSSKAPGRVLEVLVEEGDMVEKNQPVARMHLPEIEARLSQAKAQQRAALAQQSLVEEGARPQEKEAARAEWERAEADADLARKTYRRISALFDDGLVSRQKSGLTHLKKVLK